MAISPVASSATNIQQFPRAGDSTGTPSPSSNSGIIGSSQNINELNSPRIISETQNTENRRDLQQFLGSPQNREFLSSLIDVQENFVRSFEDISDVPSQVGPLFEEREVSETTSSNDEFASLQQGVNTQELQSDEQQEIIFQRLQEQFQAFQNNNNSSSLNIEIATV